MKMFTTPKNKIESLNEFSYWTFIEENLHNYYSDDRVLKSDILLRYLDGETIGFFPVLLRGRDGHQRNRLDTHLLFELNHIFGNLGEVQRDAAHFHVEFAQLVDTGNPHVRRQHRGNVFEQNNPAFLAHLD